jgi:hypothetical protein
MTGCGSDKKTEIIGKWKDQHGNIVEFTEDGVVDGLTKNVKREHVRGTYDVTNDTLYIDFLVAPEPRNIRGTLEFPIQKLNSDSLILYTDLGNINYAKLKEE